MSVYYRLFALTPQMEPVERNDQNQVDASVDIEIVVLCSLIQIPLVTQFHIWIMLPPGGEKWEMHK